MTPGDYLNVKPALAKSWERTPDGKGWRFHLTEAKFNSGNPVTAQDVKWTFDRLINLKDQPSQYVTNVSSVNVVDPKTVDMMLIGSDPADPDHPVRSRISASWSRRRWRRRAAPQRRMRTPPTRQRNWLNQHSAGAGPFTLVGWTRGAQILLTRNPHYFHGPAHFEHVIVRHMGDSATQLLAIKRGDIGAAFNLIPEQIATLKDDKQLRIEGLHSLDYVYMALTNEPEYNKALAVKEARQAIACAIDYDGIINHLLGGKAMRCASFIPIGLYGSTEETTKQIGWHQDLDRSKQLLQKAGFPNGFEFKITYGDAAVSGLSYAVLAQKLQSDLARVGIKVVLDPIDQVNLRTQYTTGHSQGGVLTFWNPSGVETDQWASASVLRVAKRIHWTPDPALKKLVLQAAAEQDPAKRTALYVDYEKALIDQSSLLILFQPIYQFAVRNSLKTFPLTAAGWEAELSEAT